MHAYTYTHPYTYASILLYAFSYLDVLTMYRIIIWCIDLNKFAFTWEGFFCMCTFSLCLLCVYVRACIHMYVYYYYVHSTIWYHALHKYLYITYSNNALLSAVLLCCFSFLIFFSLFDANAFQCICNMYSHLPTYMYIYIYTYMYIYIYIYIYMYMYIYSTRHVSYECRVTWRYVCTYIYMYIYIYSYMYMYMYIYVKINFTRHVSYELRVA